MPLKISCNCLVQKKIFPHPYCTEILCIQFHLLFEKFYDDFRFKSVALNILGLLRFDLVHKDFLFYK